MSIRRQLSLQLEQIALDSPSKSAGATSTATSSSTSSSSSSDNNDNKRLSYELDDNAYRQHGVSIGIDYLRLQGATVSLSSSSQGNLRADEFEWEDAISSIIGRGAFSTVHRAIWKKKKENIVVVVALKRCTLLDVSSQRRKMLLQEIKTLHACCQNCPNLITLHGGFLQPNDGGSVTLVLEYMDQGSLQDLLLARQHHQGRDNTVLPLPLAMVAAVTYQICHGLAHLHTPPIQLHRDLKPANALLNRAGYVKLCDFGLCSSHNADDAWCSMNTTVLGTYQYMAPERLRGKPYGRASDVWSVGLICWQCVDPRGALPWADAADVLSVVDLLVTVEELDVDALLKSQRRRALAAANTAPLEPGLVEILRWCLQREPAKRMPVDILLQSPWFPHDHGIQALSDAVRSVKAFFESSSAAAPVS